MEQSPPGHERNFAAKPLTAFRAAVETLKPGATGSDMVRLLDHRVKRTTALEWKAGRVHAPRWALELLAAKILADAVPKIKVARQLQEMPERPGLKAGARNLAVYLANRNR